MWFQSDFKELNITMVGLGYVGLPEAIAFHELGFKVSGIDINKKIIDMIRNRISPLIDEVESIKIPEQNDSWIITDEFNEIIPNSDIAIVAVPTPINDDLSPDLRPLRSAIESIFKEIIEGQKIILVIESTVYPGATRKLVNSLGNEYNKKENLDYMIAYCPERVNPGDSAHSVKKVARVIGCGDEELGKELAMIYSLITEGGCEFVGSIEVAEAAKMIENVQRDVDIALINELSIVLSDFGLDIEEVLKAADSKWNFHRHTPGVGVGGHCIPVDPYYYISLAKEYGHDASISINARRTNENMPNHVLNEIIKICKVENKRLARVLILGYAYKPNVGDCRMTPIKKLSELLNKSGINVTIWDPHISRENNVVGDLIITDKNSLYSLKEYDMIILGTAHEEIINLDWEALKSVSNNSLIYDGRRVLDYSHLENIGWKYYGIGRPIEKEVI